MKNKIVQEIEDFQEKCIGLATGKNVDYKEYEASRMNLVSEQSITSYIPGWVYDCRYGSQFWSLMKKTSSTYQGRREFIWNSLGPLLDHVEKGGSEPVGVSVNRILSTCNSNTVSEAWRRIHERRNSDPEGAITAARSLVESTCKFILDQMGESYTNRENLPKLYKIVASKMSLSPAQHNEQIFKQILSGCSSAISGFASLRNAYGDAHGKGKKAVSPEPRHADLAINLAGSISSFLISTYEERIKVQQYNEGDVLK